MIKSFVEATAQMAVRVGQVVIIHDSRSGRNATRVWNIALVLEFTPLVLNVRKLPRFFKTALNDLKAMLLVERLRGSIALKSVQP